jgi:hypothetical protein
MDKRIQALLIVALFGSTLCADEVLVRRDDDRRDQTKLRRLTDRSFRHESAPIQFTIPAEWQEISPHRLVRVLEPQPTTILGIEYAERSVVATLYWIPLPETAKLSDWITDQPVKGEYGEEYETLKTVYGVKNITPPQKMKFGSFDVYKIGITGGPQASEKQTGSLYLFEASKGTSRWLLKARISSTGPIPSDNFAETVLKGYSMVEEEGSEGAKIINVKRVKE